MKQLRHLTFFALGLGTLASCLEAPQTTDAPAATEADKRGAIKLGLPLACPPGFSTQGNGITISQAAIEDGVLKAQLLHSAGCGDHFFTACLLNEESSEFGSAGDVITPGELGNGNEVPVAQIAISHQTDNICEAIGFSEIEIDLSRLERFARSGKNGLNSEGIASDFAGEDIWVELLGADPIEPLPLTIAAADTREQAFIDAAEHARWTSEMDAGPVYIETRNSSTTGPNVRKIRKAFGIDAAYAIKAFSRQESASELEWLAFDPSWRAIQTFMAEQTGTSFRMYKIGPSEDGGLADDAGSYTYLFIGKDVNNPRLLVGFYARSVET